MSARALWPLALAVLLSASPGASSRLGAQRAPAPPPSRADQFLAVGRLSLAERELYAAVAAQPREPAHRGALARYLASRGQFRIAEVLFLEALRFGADTAVIARALAAMEPYRPHADRRAIPGVRTPSAIIARSAARSTRGAAEVIDGSEVIVPVVMSEDGKSLARFRARGSRDSVWVMIDPTREGIAVSSATDSAMVMEAFGGHGSGTPVLIEELWIGDRRLGWLDAYVDQSVPAGEVRLGVDLFWRLRAVIDERGGVATMTLPYHGSRFAPPPRSFYLPVVLRFPGLLLVPLPGMVPMSIESPEGRNVLRGTRWQLDPATSTIIVTR